MKPSISPVSNFVHQFLLHFYMKSVHRIAKNSVWKFRNIAKEDSTLMEMLPAIRHYAVLQAKIKHWENMGAQIIRLLYFLTAFLTIIVLPYQAKTYFSYKSNWAILLFSILLFFLNISFLQKALKSLLPKSGEQFVRGIIWGIDIFLAILIYHYLFNSHLWLHDVFLALLGQIVFLSAVFFFLICLALNKTLFEHINNNSSIEAATTNLLIDVLQILKSAHYWTDIGVRQSLVVKIEQIANNIQVTMRGKIKSGDPVTQDWHEKHIDKIATAFRSKKQWILLPKSDTRDSLVKYISVTIVSICKGDWDSLEKKEATNVSKPKVWANGLKIAAQNVFKFIISAGFPVLLLWTIQNTSLKLTTPVIDYAVGGIMLWVLFSFLAIFDSLFQIKLEAIKDLLSL